ncbi:Nitrogen regulatory protein p-ii-like protein [Thalictrum thalictroides]|uniref:Nitrogen regulatory protein p-ii-like protein n=1 Tax=Thalictrum thalictroides TaxID=46969 RepID=A0A7J6UZT6_THATH|nr:Nitrogen regulatory protein p-ii-like protein [Thalictrum thalictroides]
MASAMAKSQTLNPNPICSHLKDSSRIDSKLVFRNLKKSQVSQFNVSIKQVKNARFHPVVRAQSNKQDYMPDSKFYKIEAILRPWRVQQVSSGLLKMGIRGVTVSDVRGFGAQGGSTERQAGKHYHSKGVSFQDFVISWNVLVA